MSISTTQFCEIPVEFDLEITRVVPESIKSVGEMTEILDKDVVATEEDGKWIVEGFAATSDIDLQDEIIEPEAIELAASDLLENSTVLWNHHDDEPIGKVVHAEAKSDGLFIKVEISKTAELKWRQIKEGVLNKFSIRGKILDAKKRYLKSEQKWVRVIKKMSLVEVSLVSVPANPKAKAIRWYVAKALSDFVQSGGSIPDENKETSKIQENSMSNVNDDTQLDKANAVLELEEDKQAVDSSVSTTEEQPAEEAPEVADNQTDAPQPQDSDSEKETSVEDVKSEADESVDVSDSETKTDETSDGNAKLTFGKPELDVSFIQLSDDEKDKIKQALKILNTILKVTPKDSDKEKQEASDKPDLKAASLKKIKSVLVKLLTDNYPYPVIKNLPVAEKASDMDFFDDEEEEMTEDKVFDAAVESIFKAELMRQMLQWVEALLAREPEEESRRMLMMMRAALMRATGEGQEAAPEQMAASYGSRETFNPDVDSRLARMIEIPLATLGKDSDTTAIKFLAEYLAKQELDDITKYAVDELNGTLGNEKDNIDKVDAALSLLGKKHDESRILFLIDSILSKCDSGALRQVRGIAQAALEMAKDAGIPVVEEVEVTEPEDISNSPLPFNSNFDHNKMAELVNAKVQEAVAGAIEDVAKRLEESFVNTASDTVAKTFGNVSETAIKALDERLAKIENLNGLSKSIKAQVNPESNSSVNGNKSGSAIFRGILSQNLRMRNH